MSRVAAARRPIRNQFWKCTGTGSRVCRDPVLEVLRIFFFVEHPLNVRCFLVSRWGRTLCDRRRLTILVFVERCRLWCRPLSTAKFPFGPLLLKSVLPSSFGSRNRTFAVVDPPPASPAGVGIVALARDAMSGHSRDAVGIVVAHCCSRWRDAFSTGEQLFVAASPFELRTRVTIWLNTKTVRPTLNGMFFC